jgi:phospholipase/carboxylesterase
MRSPILLLLLAACRPPEQPPAADAPGPAQPALLDHVVLLTGGAQEDETLPLLVAIHGMGSRPERFATSLEGLEIPARVILPLAPHPTPGGGGSWFGFRRGDPDRVALGQRLHEACDPVLALMDWAEQRYPTRGEPVITGFSQGGMISFAIAAGWPEHIQAAFPMGGDLPLSLVPAQAPEEPPRVVAFHGEADEVVPIEPVRVAVRALEDRGYPAELNSYAGVAHAIGPRMRADWYAALAAALRGAPEALPEVPCPPVDGRPAATASLQRVPLGERALWVETCPVPGGTTAVRARLEGGDWAWQGDYDFEHPSWENERVHGFEHVGRVLDDQDVLAMSYTACEHDGCDRVAFLLVEPDGAVSTLAEQTRAHAWGVAEDGSFHYVEKTGYSMGYHIASAAFTYRWAGQGLERQAPPIPKAEYERWPCPASTVQPVGRGDRQPVGEPLAVPQGAPIRVLATDPREPGRMFEYEVEGRRFWALDWQQTCAG